MIGRLRPWGLLLLGVLAWGTGTTAWADDLQTLPLDRHGALPTSQRLRAEVLGVPAGNRHGGYGFVRARLVNPDDRAHVVRLSLLPSFLWFRSDDSAPQRVVRTLSLESGETATVYLPMVNTSGGSTLHFSVDGRPVGDQAQFSGGGSRQSDAASVLGVWRDDAVRLQRWRQFLEPKTPPSRRGGAALQLDSLEPRNLPDRWVLLSGFDLVLVDCQSPDLNLERERVLVGYAAGGGALGLLRPRSEGPLAEMLAATRTRADARSGFHGLGRWFATTAAGPEADMAGWLQADPQAGAYGVLQSATRKYAGSLPTPFWLPLQIPGLGEVPLKAFFLLILAFAIVVGPINYLYFRRQRKLPMLLLTIPAAGFLCTVVILLYGLFSEGFGVIGAARSFSVLDQRTHTTATCMAQTLYAGLQPQDLYPAPDSFFCSSSFVLEGNDRDATAIFHTDLDDGYRVDGSALPSRTATPFTSVRVGRARERLRFRRRPDGSYDALAAPGFAPQEAAGAVLLRTTDGAYYEMDAAGVLRPRALDERARAERIDALLGELRGMPLGSGEVHEDNDYWNSGRAFRSREDMAVLASGAEGLERWLRWRLPTLPKGSYLARMQAPPVGESFGLDIEYRAQSHVVLGLLDAEDVIDD